MPLKKGNTEPVSNESIDFISPANRYLKVRQGLGGTWGKPESGRCRHVPRREKGTLEVGRPVD